MGIKHRMSDNNRYRILVVDDEESLCEILKFNLTKEGYDVVTAYSAEEALALKLTDIDLVILDIMMGELSGFSFAKILKTREETSHIPIIFCSALDNESDKIKGLDMGADDYITKPFNPIEVLARVRSQLRRYFTLGGSDKTDDVITIGGLEIDNREKKFLLDGEEIE